MMVDLMEHNLCLGVVKQEMTIQCLMHEMQ